MKNSYLVFSIILIAASAVTGSAQNFNETMLKALEYRSIGPAVQGPSRSAFFWDRTGANGVIVPHRPIPSGSMSNQILTFQPCPRKLRKA